MVDVARVHCTNLIRRVGHYSGSLVPCLHCVSAVGHLPTSGLRGVPGEGGELEGAQSHCFVVVYSVLLLSGYLDLMLVELNGIKVGTMACALCHCLQITMKYFQNVVDIVRDLMSPTAQEKHYKEGASPSRE